MLTLSYDANAVIRVSELSEVNDDAFSQTSHPGPSERCRTDHKNVGHMQLHFRNSPTIVDSRGIAKHG